MNQSSIPSRPLQISQGFLTTLETCPRKFQHLYLEQLVLPTQRSQWEWGQRFHLLMQQQELGLPAIAHTPQEQAMVNATQLLQTAIAEQLKDENIFFRDSEHQRMALHKEFQLMGIYDLLVLSDRHAYIFDWKTYAQPRSIESLLKSWQTQLYPYILVETSDYQPEQVVMTYYFVQTGTETASLQHWSFHYSATHHRQIQHAIAAQLTQLQGWLALHPADIALPQVPESHGHCQKCPFATRCQRSSVSLPEGKEETKPLWLDVAQIEEVEI